MQAIVVVLVIVVAAGAGVYFFVLGKPQSGPSSSQIDLSIVESDPVNQVDSFNPTNITVSHDTSVTLAIQNGDDVARTFEISAFNVNQTIESGGAERITFNVGQPGVFMMVLPPAPAANGLKASPMVTGYFIVT
jgi:uncharacterized membrane protein